MASTIEPVASTIEPVADTIEPVASATAPVASTTVSTGAAALKTRKRRRRASLHGLPHVVGTLLLWGGGLIMLIPFAWMVLSSFKPLLEIMSPEVQLLPQNPSLDNFSKLFTNYAFLQYILNSLVVTTCICFSITVSAVLLGFVFAKAKFRGRNFVFLIFLATMALPFEIIAVPLLLEFQTFNGLDSLPTLIVPFMVDAFPIFLCRQFISTIPNDYLDAARVDGANDLQVLWNIVVPMIRPAIAAVAILSFLYNWDQLFWPLVSIASDANRTVPLGIVALSTQFGPAYDLTMAASTLTVLPVIVVFLLLRRHFISGMALSGLGGR
jgi:multiple sugar transport system permease protein